MTLRIPCELCGKPIPIYISTGKKYHSECAKVVKRIQARKHYYKSKNLPI